MEALSAPPIIEIGRGCLTKVSILTAMFRLPDHAGIRLPSTRELIVMMTIRRLECENGLQSSRYHSPSVRSPRLTPIESAITYRCLPLTRTYWYE